MQVMTIGKAVKTLRLESGLSQARMAERVSTEESTIYRQQVSRYEAGLDLPKLPALLAILEGLGVTLTDLEQVCRLHEAGKDSAEVIEWRHTQAQVKTIDDVIELLTRPLLEEIARLLERQHAHVTGVD